MVYLLLGDDLKAKDAYLAKLKKTAFISEEACLFDADSLDALDLPQDALKKSLITLPVMNPKRMVVVRNVHKLKSADIVSLSAYLEKPSANVELVLESKEEALKGEFSKIVSLCSTEVFTLPVKPNVFDMTRQMAAGRQKDALNTLSIIFSDGTHPLQIMGGLFAYWSRDGRKLTPASFENGLHVLEEADVNIKRSRLDERFAVEKAVVELCGLLGRG